jgi:hypothetical protein
LRAILPRNLREQAMAGVRGSHPAGPLVAVEREAEHAEPVRPEDFIETRLQRPGLAG